jgi:zinc transport system substrate-binding protein
MKHFLLLICLLLFPLAGSAAPRIVVTLQPVHTLISEVTKGITVPELPVAKKLHQADIIFMVSRDFEKPPTISNATIIELITLEGIKTLPLRTDAIWVDSEKPQATFQPDPHIWLDPDNAIIIVNKAAEILAQKDPAHSKLYTQNAQRMTAQLTQMDKEIGDKLAPYSDVAYLVTQDAYQYFEKHYHLKSIGAVNLKPDQTPDASTMKTLQDTITRHNAVCLFGEADFPAQLLNFISTTTHIGTGILNSEGEKNSYFSLMRGLSHNLLECFDKNRSLPS